MDGQGNTSDKRQRDASGDGANGAGPPLSKKARKAAIKQSPVYLARQQIHQACKRNDQAAAVKLYEQIRGHPIDAALYNTLIHLTSGQWDWEEVSRAAFAALRGAAGDSGAAPPLLCHLPQHTYELAGGAANGGAAAQPPGAAVPSGQQPGGTDGTASVAAGEAPGDGSVAATAAQPAEAVSRERLLDMAEQLFVEMQAAGHKPDESTYTHMARVACIRQQPERALEYARTVVALGQAKGLRLWQPALVGAALRGDTAIADEADTMIKAAGLDLTEGELALLLECASNAGQQARLEAVLRRMSDNLNALSDSTIELARRHFDRPQRHAEWTLQPSVRVDDSGYCAEAGARVQLLDLAAPEWAAFADAVASLAIKSEKRAAFGGFQEWLQRHGPFNVLIDGANVALFGQNWEEGRFDVGQVMQVWQQVADGVPDARPLLILHTRRQADIAEASPEEQQWVEQLRQRRQIFFVPRGSNDDWYWLYACVAARSNGLLVSNDEMRDHIWSLLRPKHFLKWKDRHVARYSVRPGRGATIQFPTPYTRCVQQLPTGAWILPSSSRGDWLLAKPAGFSPAAGG